MKITCNLLLLLFMPFARLQFVWTVFTCQSIYIKDLKKEPMNHESRPLIALNVKEEIGFSPRLDKLIYVIEIGLDYY